MIEIIPNWHPIFVHFTVALISVATILKLSTYVIKNEIIREQLRTVARWNLWIGAGFVVVTVLTGWVAFNSVSHDTPSHLAMTEHRNWALVTATLILFVAGWSIKHVRAGKNAHVVLVLALVVAATLVTITAWRGGELVYRYGLGVMSLPKASSHDHASGEEHGHDSEMTNSHDNADGHHDKSAHDNSDGHHDAR